MAGASVKQRSLYDHVPPYLVDLSQGTPPDSLLKASVEILKQGTPHLTDQDDSYKFFSYGPAEGAGEYREAVATMLTEQYQAPVNCEDVVLTAGATHGLHLIAHLLFSPRDIAFVENPTYPPAIALLRDQAHLRTLGIPMDDHGVIPDALEELIEENKHYQPRELTGKKPFWGILYILSCFHTPCGTNLTSDRCRALVKMARKHNLLVVCDDVYNLLYHDRPPLRLFSYDSKNDLDYSGNVVSNGSFSKLFGPGLKLGWMEAPNRVRDILLQAGCALSGGSYNQVMSGVMASIIKLGLLQDMLASSRTQYKDKCETMCKALTKEMPSAHFAQPTGGYFIWLRLPDGTDSEELLRLCEDTYKLSFSPGPRSSVDGSFKNFVRLSFSKYDRETLVDAVRQLGKAVKEVRTSE